MDSIFRVGHSTRSEWSDAVHHCLEQIGAVNDFNLGFLYVVEPFGQVLDLILEKLQQETKIRSWTGASALGVVANDVEYFNEQAIVLMVARLPQGSFETFRETFRADKQFAVVHADPRRPDIVQHIHELSNAQEGFLVGGLTTPESRRIDNRSVADWATTGVAFTETVAVQTGVTQGCVPIGPIHLITECRDNIVITIDKKPALDTFKDEIGEVFANHIERTAGYIFAGIPVAGSDTGDYLVRNILGVDLENRHLAIESSFERGDQLMFCKRDPATAQTDLINMAEGVARRLSRPPLGALYYSCVARGPNLFGTDSEEIKIIQSALGFDNKALPLVGFFANGEISHNRLYTHTGVLTVFC